MFIIKYLAILVVVAALIVGSIAALVALPFYYTIPVVFLLFCIVAFIRFANFLTK